MQAITYQNTQEPAKTNEDILDAQPSDQALQQESCTLDTLLQNIINPETQSQHIEKPKSLASSKRPRNKRNTMESKSHMKPSYKPPVTNSNTIEVDNDSITVDNTTPKRRKRNVDISTKNKYQSPAQAPKHIKESNSNQQSTTELK